MQFVRRYVRLTDLIQGVISVKKPLSNNSVVVASDATYDAHTATSSYGFVMFCQNSSYYGFCTRDYTRLAYSSFVDLIRPTGFDTSLLRTENKWPDEVDTRDYSVATAENSALVFSLTEAMRICDSLGIVQPDIHAITDCESVHDAIYAYSGMSELELRLQYKGNLNVNSLAQVVDMINALGLMVYFSHREFNKLAHSVCELAVMMQCSEQRLWRKYKSFWELYVSYKLDMGSSLSLLPLNLDGEEISSLNKLNSRIDFQNLLEFGKEFGEELEALPISCFLVEKLDFNSAELPRLLHGVLFLHFLREDGNAYEVLFCVAYELYNRCLHTSKNKSKTPNAVLEDMWRQLQLELTLCRGKRLEDLPSYSTISRTKSNNSS